MRPGRHPGDHAPHGSGHSIHLGIAQRFVDRHLNHFGGALGARRVRLNSANSGSRLQTSTCSVSMSMPRRMHSVTTLSRSGV